MIKEEIIQRADEYLQKLSDTALNKYINEIEEDQGAIITYMNAMGDLFEENDDFFEKYIYFFLLIHRSYTNRFRFFPKISLETISRIEEDNNRFFSDLSTKSQEEYDTIIESYIEKHPQRVLLDFITMDLFENDNEAYDDISLELDNQIFFLLLTVVNIYEESLILSQKDITKK